MREVKIYILFIIFMLSACDFELDENIPIGNPNLKITGISPQRGLRGDTLTIYGEGFNPIAYQNSVSFEVEPGLAENRIVDSTPDSIKVIIPDNALTGDVKVFFGVDTVKSPQIFELISLLKRPTITMVEPEFGAPGTKINIQMPTGLPDGELPVILFGKTFVSVATTDSRLVYSVRVPPLLPGPVNLQGGIITSVGDTLLSKPFSFGVLPGVSDIPLMLWTSYSSGYDVSKGEVTEEAIEVDVLYPETDPGKRRQGIALNKSNSNAYWISNLINPSGETRAVLLRGKTNGERPVRELQLQRQFNDIEIANNYVYLTGGLLDINAEGKQNIRRYGLDANGDITGGAKLIYEDATKSSITNLKVVGNNFYWCDSYNKKIYKAILTADKLGSPVFIFNGGPLINPTAIAIDEQGQVFYVADRTGQLLTDKTILWKGSLASPGDPLIKLYEKEGAKISDLEIDIPNKFLYWITTDGIYRKAFDKLADTSKPIQVYTGKGGNYFDF